MSAPASSLAPASRPKRGKSKPKSAKQLPEISDQSKAPVKRSKEEMMANSDGNDLEMANNKKRSRKASTKRKKGVFIATQTGVQDSGEVVSSTGSAVGAQVGDKSADQGSNKAGGSVGLSDDKIATQNSNEAGGKIGEKIGEKIGSEDDNLDTDDNPLGYIVPQYFFPDAAAGKEKEKEKEKIDKREDSGNAGHGSADAGDNSGNVRDDSGDVGDDSGNFGDDSGDVGDDLGNAGRERERNDSGKADHSRERVDFRGSGGSGVSDDSGVELVSKGDSVRGGQSQGRSGSAGASSSRKSPSALRTPQGGVPLRIRMRPGQLPLQMLFSLGTNVIP
jgi:hypothetical protein